MEVCHNLLILRVFTAGAGVYQGRAGRLYEVGRIERIYGRMVRCVGMGNAGMAIQSTITHILRSGQAGGRANFPM